MSKGQIPDVFLRGCGVPENFIRHMKSLTMDPIEYYSCFISYSHQDKSFARRLHDQLQARGIRCWLDEKQLLPGDDIYEQVDRGVRLWDKVLLCCSKHSLASWWVDNEVATAFSKEQQLMKDRGKKVLSLIPLNLDGYMFSNEWTSGKSQQIKERLAADFTGWETDNAKFEEQFGRVVKQHSLFQSSAVRLRSVQFRSVSKSVQDSFNSIECGVASLRWYLVQQILYRFVKINRTLLLSASCDMMLSKSSDYLTILVRMVDGDCQKIVRVAVWVAGPYLAGGEL